MAKTFSTYPAALDDFSTDRASGDTITSNSYDIIETALSAIEGKLALGTGLSAATISGTTVCGSTVGALTVTGTTLTATTFTGTNVYATTVTATNLTATNISATTYENAGLVWTSVAGTTVTMTGNNGYIMNNAGILSATMPATCTLGHTIEIAGLGAGGWRIIQLAGQTIHFGNLDTTTGATGYLSASLAHDCVRLICVTANTDFVVASSIGNIVIA